MLYQPGKRAAHLQGDVPKMRLRPSRWLRITFLQSNLYFAGAAVGKEKGERKSRHNLLCDVTLQMVSISGSGLQLSQSLVTMNSLCCSTQARRAVHLQSVVPKVHRPPSRGLRITCLLSNLWFAGAAVGEEKGEKEKGVTTFCAM